MHLKTEQKCRIIYHSKLILYIYFTCCQHLDAPEIEVERALIHTGVGYEAQLICIVHAEPPPHVVWYKDTTQLGTTEQHSQQVCVFHFLLY